MKPKIINRIYGVPPFSVILLHGGPGAAGTLSTMAKELSSEFGVIEAIQTSDSIDGQLEELLSVIKMNCLTPVLVVGHSWGAWLACLFASAYTEFCKSSILVSCPPFESKYEDEINRSRMDRMNESDFEKFDNLAKILKGKVKGDKNKAFAEIGNLFFMIDSFSRTIENPGEIHCDFQIYSNVWAQASGLRKTGELLRIVEKIKCPISFIHGDHDPHPVSGIKEPLDKLEIKYKFIGLKNCGHYPWLEPDVKRKFYDLLKELLKSDIENIQ